MSIKLSIKELKDLLKLNKLAIKKRKRSKKRLGKAIQNQNIRSTSAHMISSGTTMMNTANEQGELIRLQRQALEDKLRDDKENKIKKEVKEKEAKEQHELDNAGGMVPYSRLSGNGGSNNLRDEVTNQHKTLTYMMMMPGSMYFPLQGTSRRETEEGAEPGNVGYASEEPRVEEPRVEELKNEKSSGGFDDGSANANAKPPGADAEVKNVFDPNTLDINAAEKWQLIGWINFKRGYTDANLPEKTPRQLFFIARGIKYKEEGEADEEAFKKEQAEKAAAAQAKVEAAKAKAEAEAARARAAAKAKEEAEAEAAKKMARKLRKEAEAKAKEEAEAAAEAAAEARAAARARRAQEAEEAEEARIRVIKSGKKIKASSSSISSSRTSSPVKKGR